MKNDDKDESPEFFVSRRGRQVGVHQVDLSGIDIEHETPVEKAPKPAKTKRTAEKKEKKPVPVQKPKRERTGWTRKKVIILAVALVVLLMPIALAEIVTAQYRSGIDGAKTDLTKIVNGSVLPAQKKSSITADQVRSMANQVNDIIGHMCRGGLIDNAAGLYSRAKSALIDCKTTQSKYSALANNLYKLEGQARYLENIDALIKPVATPITDAFAVIGSQQTSWQTVADGLKKLSPPEEMKAAHDELLKHVSGVTDAWSKLNIANNAQNSIDFAASEKTLGSEYEAVRSSNAPFNAVIAKTQTSVTAAYATLK